MGLSVAKLLASKGANVAIIARNREKLDKAVADIEVRFLSPLTPPPPLESWG